VKYESLWLIPAKSDTGILASTPERFPEILDDRKIIVSKNEIILQVVG
jgi:hypothetical protein